MRANDRRLALALGALLFASQAPAQVQWGKFIPPDYPWLRWSGRVLFRGKAARFDWSQVGLACEFAGPACAIYLEPGDNNFNAFVDGELKAILGPPPLSPLLQNDPKWIKPEAGQKGVWVLDGLGPGLHRLEIDKRSGANFGVAKFYGMRLTEASSLTEPPPAPPHKLEFIGDSFTNAYGCESGAVKCSGRRSFENGWKSYAALAARELNAEMQVIALSGYGVVRNYGDHNQVSKEPMPLFYSRVIAGLDTAVWDRSKFKPDAIVVNLGTNDFSTKPVPSAEMFLKGYLGLLDQALDGRAGTPVFIVSVKGSRLQAACLAEVTAAAQARGMDAQLVEFDGIRQSELGCDAHPQAIVHERWAKALEIALKDHLHW